MGSATEIAIDELLEVARQAAQAGAEVATAWARRREELQVEEKAAADDLVSQADRDTESAIRAVLAEMRPDDAVLGEEHGDASGSSGIRWFVDPIDGTTNYLYGRPDWAVSVAAVSSADTKTLVGVVAEPALGRLTAASRGGGAWSEGRRLRRQGPIELERALVEVNLGRPEQRPRAQALFEALVGQVRDVRRGGSAAAALAQVADGRADAYWGPGLQPWDGAAGTLIVSEAGGEVGNLYEPTAGDWPASGDVLAAAPSLWEPLREILRGVYR
ncbi:MAG TPA: inositol monophosphatase family protein [Solirubrobacterales bacterium]|nr:inositol monophosphatase family protein [Solirubrobacterales bacterium]